MFCKIFLSSREIHKLPKLPKSYEELSDITLKKFKAKIPEKFEFKYQDTDNELISLSNEEDFQTAVFTSESDHVKTLRIYILPEKGIPENNVNLTQNVLPSYNSTSYNQSSVNNSSPAWLPVNRFYSQGFERKISEGTENLGDADLSRLTREKEGGFEKSQGGQVHQGEKEILNQEQFTRRPFSFDGPAGMYHGAQNVYGIGGASSFTQEQLNTISEILDRRLRMVENNVQSIMTDIVSKLNDGFSNTAVKKKHPYTHTPYMPKNLAPTPGVLSRSLSKKSTIVENEEGTCSDCQQKIETIKYSCQECSGKIFCETCEAKGEHPHSLLKTRLNKRQREAKNEGEEAQEDQGLPERLSLSQVKAKSIVNGSSSKDQKPKEYKSLTSPNSFELPDKKDIQGSSLAKNKSNMKQSLLYSKVGPTTPGEGLEKEVKKYKATIIKQSVYDIINVKPEHIYHVEFTVKNAGGDKWPSDIKVVCISGIHKGIEQGLPSLASNEKFIVKLELKAPSKIDSYLSEWRLQYQDESGTKGFGSSLFIEISVKEPKRERQVEEKNERQNLNIKQEEKGLSLLEIKDDKKSIEKERAKIDDTSRAEGQEKESAKDIGQHVRQETLEELKERLKRETGCTDDELESALQLHEMFGDTTLKSKIEYIKDFALDLDINELAERYQAFIFEENPF